MCQISAKRDWRNARVVGSPRVAGNFIGERPGPLDTTGVGRSNSTGCSGISVVWGPYLVDSLVNEGVPPSSITLVLLTRSPCNVPRGILNDSLRRIQIYNRLPGLVTNASIDLLSEYFLRMTIDTIAKLRARGTRVVLVDYQQLLIDPDGTAGSLSQLLPCVGSLNASAPPRGDTILHNGRNSSIREFVHNQPNASKNNRDFFATA
eukprot:CAMPEP_0119324466 /NCGR_PEP_ID=MMETSP1333-20130426/63317_1 /TAXON_ID=418940 /ORGANISM="Scyphosphaera apsteinii, Strain RCC1455" /LENGTH=205 /DNA_ID=CAMNT_0007332169 /DNA_START=328 /DNA_END=941 /DNA_ORIENTATION=+